MFFIFFNFFLYLYNNTSHHSPSWHTQNTQNQGIFQYRPMDFIWQFHSSKIHKRCLQWKYMEYIHFNSKEILPKHMIKLHPWATDLRHKAIWSETDHVTRNSNFLLYRVQIYMSVYYHWRVSHELYLKMVRESTWLIHFILLIHRWNDFANKMIKFKLHNGDSYMLICTKYWDSQKYVQRSKVNDKLENTSNVYLVYRLPKSLDHLTFCEIRLT